jgi:membrane protein DedA with SNARE-associated domain
MFIESLGIPFGSIPLVLGSGYLVNTGEASYISVVLVSSIGATLGSIVSYYIGLYGGKFVRRCNKGKITKHENKIDKFVRKHGKLSLVLAQLFGPTRTFASIPAGAMKMDIKEFIVGTFIGSVIFALMMVFLSSLLGNFIGAIAAYLGIPVWLSFVLTIIASILMLRAYASAKNQDDCHQD